MNSLARPGAREVDLPASMAAYGIRLLTASRSCGGFQGVFPDREGRALRTENRRGPRWAPGSERTPQGLLFQLEPLKRPAAAASVGFRYRACRVPVSFSGLIGGPPAPRTI